MCAAVLLLLVTGCSQEGAEVTLEGLRVSQVEKIEEQGPGFVSTFTPGEEFVLVEVSGRFTPIADDALTADLVDISLAGEAVSGDTSYSWVAHPEAIGIETRGGCAGYKFAEPIQQGSVTIEHDEHGGFELGRRGPGGPTFVTIHGASDLCLAFAIPASINSGSTLHFKRDRTRLPQIEIEIQGGQERWISDVLLVVDEEHVAVIYETNPPPGQSTSLLDPSEYFIPGRVIAFRATKSLPQFAGTGQRGRVYRLNEQRELVEIGEFDSELSDDELREEVGAMLGDR